MYTIRKSFKVEYAHQLDSAFTKECYETIHGHSALVEVFFLSNRLDSANMVIDFGKISSLLKEVIMEFDHALIIPCTFHHNYINILKTYNKKLVILDANPTAEYFCKYLYDKISKKLSVVITHSVDGIHFEKIRFHETATGYAEYKPR